MGVERRCCLGCAKSEMTSYAVFLRETTVMWICITLALLQYNSSEHDVNQVCLASPPCRSSSDVRTPDDVHCQLETIEPGIELRGEDRCQVKMIEPGIELRDEDRGRTRQSTACS